jgi:hypothetical protein
VTECNLIQEVGRAGVRRTISLLAALVLVAPACQDQQPAKQALDFPHGLAHAAEVTAARGGGAQAVERPLSVAERALLRGYYAALQSPGVRKVTLENLLLQIRRNPPVAFVDGYWATPIDLSALFQLPAVRGALETALPGGPAREEPSQLLADPNRLKQLTAFAFTANPLKSQVGLPDVGKFDRVKTSEMAAIGVFIAPVKDVEWVVVEYLPPMVVAPDAEPECYFFCGDPATWDFDGDRIPDAQDTDDDNDGVPDHADDYPYWPGGNDCGCAAETVIFFITKFASGITSAVLTAYALVENANGVSRGVMVGPTPGGDGAVQFIFPTAVLPLEERPRAGECPDPGDPRVRYIHTDPHACAAIRFRCRQGEVAFSNDCGCGCRVP